MKNSCSVGGYLTFLAMYVREKILLHRMSNSLRCRVRCLSLVALWKVSWTVRSYSGPEVKI
jgi:hypothetical protein